MATAKKRTSAAPRTSELEAPRELWIVLDDNGTEEGAILSAVRHKHDAQPHSSRERVVGPYVLSERKRNR